MSEPLKQFVNVVRTSQKYPHFTSRLQILVYVKKILSFLCPHILKIAPANNVFAYIYLKKPKKTSILFNKEFYMGL